MYIYIYIRIYIHPYIPLGKEKKYESVMRSPSGQIIMERTKFKEDAGTYA